jgi:hypothetical protein
VTPPALNLLVKELLKFLFMYFTFESTQYCFFLYLFFPWVTILSGMQDEHKERQEVCVMTKDYDAHSDLLSDTSVVWWLACWLLVPEFAGSNLAEVIGFFLAHEKILSMPSFGGEVKESVPCPSFAACKRT